MIPEIKAIYYLLLNQTPKYYDFDVYQLFMIRPTIKLSKNEKIGNLRTAEYILWGLKNEN